MYVKNYYEAIEKAVASKGQQGNFTYTTGIGEDIDTIWYVDVRTDGNFLTIYISHEGIGRGCFQTDWEQDFDGDVGSWLYLNQDKYPYIPLPPGFYDASADVWDEAAF